VATYKRSVRIVEIVYVHQT